MKIRIAFAMLKREIEANKTLHPRHNLYISHLSHLHFIKIKPAASKNQTSLDEAKQKKNKKAEKSFCDCDIESPFDPILIYGIYALCTLYKLIILIRVSLGPFRFEIISNTQ